MERLTEKLTDVRNIIRGHHSAIFSTKYGHFIAGEAVDKLAEYEDAEEQGLLIRLPVPLNTNVYRITFKCRLGGACVACHKEGCWKCKSADKFVTPHIFKCEDRKEWGETVFLTREEAEEALAKI